MALDGCECSTFNDPNFQKKVASPSSYILSAMITLYDIPSTIPGNAWSPNPFKTRMALLFKGLPFKTEWVEYPDIGPRMKELGAEATAEWEDGSPRWTLPVTKDDTTGKVVADSWKIAMYLDDTYPDKPTLFPFGVRAPVDFLHAYFFNTAIRPGLPIFLSETCVKLNPPSEKIFRRAREAEFKLKMEEFAPPGPKRDAIWAAAKAGFDTFAAKYASNGDGTLPYFYGDKISYADLVVASFLWWIKVVLRSENPEWKKMEGWNDGRWVKLIELTKKYQSVDA